MTSQPIADSCKRAFVAPAFSSTPRVARVFGVSMAPLSPWLLQPSGRTASQRFCPGGHASF
jgi:hypothetical protein